jgi:hypothetical protein
MRKPIQQNTNLSFLYIVQTGSGAYPASYILDTEAVSLGIKLLKREADHSPHLASRLKIMELYLQFLIRLQSVIGNYLSVRVTSFFTTLGTLFLWVCVCVCVCEFYC